MKRATQEIFQEPGCEINRAKSESARKSGCSKQLIPGAAAGGCAFDGAKIVLQPIADAAHLVHGPAACEGNSWDNRGALSSGPLTYRTGFTTDMSELDIIYGGEKRLYRAIREIILKHNPPAVFVYQTCVPGLIGDDIEAVCKLARERFNTPVIPVVAPGYAGGKNAGNKLAGRALLDHVIGTSEPEETTPTDIALIGEYNIAGELWQVKPYLDRLGIRLLSSISGDARYKDVAHAHRARASMVVCSKAMINLARGLEERYGIPYFEGSFYGIGDTSDSLRKLAGLLVKRGADRSLIERTEKLIVEEEAVAFQKIASYAERLRGKRLLLITGGVKSWSVVSALTEIGINVIGSSAKKSTDEDREKIQRLLSEEAKMYEELSQREMYSILRNERVDIMLSGGRTQFVALKAKVPWLDINQERHHAYAGYDGMVNLVRQIDLAVSSPIWERVRKRAPWDKIE